MSVQYEQARERFVVRWREGGRQRNRRFPTEGEAIAFDSARRSESSTTLERVPTDVTSRGDGIYPYPTKAGPRWRFVFRQSDGRISSRRGFRSRRAAADARRKLVESIDRGEVKVSRETFGEFWALLLEEKRGYITAGSHQDFTSHGKKRLLPHFEDVKISAIDEVAVRRWLGTMLKLVEAGDLSPKTVNNARTCLSVALKEATRRGLVAKNPCDAIRQLPLDRKEIDYLRLPEISVYLEAAAERYRPLAEFLIGTGARMSEALAVRPSDIELADGFVRISRQQAATQSGTAPTKGKRFRSVQFGPGLGGTLEALIRSNGASARYVFLCPIPLRGRYASRTEWLHPTAVPCTTGTRRP